MFRVNISKEEIQTESLLICYLILQVVSVKKFNFLALPSKVAPIDDCFQVDLKRHLPPLGQGPARSSWRGCRAQAALPRAGESCCFDVSYLAFDLVTVIDMVRCTFCRLPGTDSIAMSVLLLCFKFSFLFIRNCCESRRLLFSFPIFLLKLYCAFLTRIKCIG